MLLLATGSLLADKYISVFIVIFSLFSQVLKLSQVVGALGKGTILKVAKSGPESKV